MFSRIAAANRRLQASTVSPILPLAFVAVLGFFVLAAALLEDPAGVFGSPSRLARFAG